LQFCCGIARTLQLNSSFIHFILYISVPGAINNLTVANVTSRSVQICWKEPCPPNGNIIDYVVNVYLSDGPQRNTTETEELCQVFEKLLPYKYYSINVTAKTKVVEGVSQSISVQTNPDGEFL
jgi:hypothetical protein